MVVLFLTCLGRICIGRFPRSKIGSRLDFQKSRLAIIKMGMTGYHLLHREEIVGENYLTSAKSPPVGGIVSKNRSIVYYFLGEFSGMLDSYNRYDTKHRKPKWPSGFDDLLLSWTFPSKQIQVWHRLASLLFWFHCAGMIVFCLKAEGILPSSNAP